MDYKIFQMLISKINTIKNTIKENTINSLEWLLGHLEKISSSRMFSI